MRRMLRFRDGLEECGLLSGRGPRAQHGDFGDTAALRLANQPIYLAGRSDGDCPCIASSSQVFSLAGRPSPFALGAL